SYFLAGELSAEGWWYYHLAAFAVKCPLPVLGAFLFSVVAWLAGRSPGRRDYAGFVPIVLLFAANAPVNPLDIGERPVLAAYPLCFIAVAPWLAGALEEAPWWPTPSGERARTEPRPRAKASRWLPAAAAALVLLWTAAGDLAIAPRYLQFFNEAAGGPERGHPVLIDSNLDC